MSIGDVISAAERPAVDELVNWSATAYSYVQQATRRRCVLVVVSSLSRIGGSTVAGFPGH